MEPSLTNSLCNIPVSIYNQGEGSWELIKGKGRENDRSFNRFSQLNFSRHVWRFKSWECVLADINLGLTVKPGKIVNTRNISGILLFQEKKPIKHEKTEPQARSSISLWFCGQFTCLDLCCHRSQHNKYSWDISSLHGFAMRSHSKRLSKSWLYFKTLCVYFLFRTGS